MRSTRPGSGFSFTATSGPFRTVRRSAAVMPVRTASAAWARKHDRQRVVDVGSQRTGDGDRIGGVALGGALVGEAAANP